MAKVTINVPEPVEATVILELTLEEAKIIRDVLGMTYGDAGDELYQTICEAALGQTRKVTVFKDKTSHKIYIKKF